MIAVTCQRSLSGSEAGDGNAEGTARDVVQTEAVAELHAVGIAAVFAANPKLDVGPTLPAVIDGDLHELANAGRLVTILWSRPSGAE